VPSACHPSHRSAQRGALPYLRRLPQHSPGSARRQEPYPCRATERRAASPPTLANLQAQFPPARRRPTRSGQRPLRGAGERPGQQRQGTTSIGLLEQFIAQFKDTYYADLTRTRIQDITRRQVAIATWRLPPPAPPVARCEGVEAQVGNTKRCVKPKDTFRDCPNCPDMVAVPAGRFSMGSPVCWRRGEGRRRACAARGRLPHASSAWKRAGLCDGQWCTTPADLSASSGMPGRRWICRDNPRYTLDA
jgi:hypothetical protein